MHKEEKRKPLLKGKRTYKNTSKTITLSLTIVMLSVSLGLLINIIDNVSADYDHSLPETSSSDKEWTLIYHTAFSEDPEWDTNNNERYYWKSMTETYQAIMYDNTDEYAKIDVSYTYNSLVFIYDWVVEDINWAGNFHIGLRAKSMKAYNTNDQMLEMGIGIGDWGKGIAFSSIDKNLDVKRYDEYPTQKWTTNVWYSVRIEYFADTGVATCIMNQISDGKEMMNVSLSGISGYDDLPCISASKIGDWYSSSARGVGQFDNIYLYEEKTIEKPIPISGGPYKGYEGLEITFDASESYDPNDRDLQYRWDFDDDGAWDTDFSWNPYVTYTYTDDYEGYIVLQVYIGNEYAEDKAMVKIGNMDPTVSFYYATLDKFILTGDNIFFFGELSDYGSGDTHSINWSFGDGTYLEGSLEVNHSFSQEGVFNITLTVTDDDGGFGSYMITIIVISDVDMLDYLIDYIKGLDLKNGNSYIVMLEKAIKNIKDGKDEDLNNFFNHLNAQKGKSLTDDNYYYIYNIASRIIA